MVNLSKAIEYFGSRKNLAEALGIHDMATRQWERRNSIPARRLKQIKHATGGVVLPCHIDPDFMDTAA